eukprot:SAG11_NODE_18614_length_486_cov_0.457364_1_plen_43_part_00
MPRSYGYVQYVWGVFFYAKVNAYPVYVSFATKFNNFYTGTGM